TPRNARRLEDSASQPARGPESRPARPAARNRLRAESRPHAVNERLKTIDAPLRTIRTIRTIWNVSQRVSAARLPMFPGRRSPRKSPTATGLFLIRRRGREPPPATTPTRPALVGKRARYASSAPSVDDAEEAK